MNDFENKIKGVLKKEVEKPLSYDYAIKNAFYNSKNKRKSNLLLKLATTTSCLIMICTGVFATSYIVYEKVWKKPVIVNQEEENSNVEKEISKEEKENEFQVMVNEARQRRVQSYLEGLEVERNRLARELHDNVSNELVAIRMEIEGGKSTPQEIMNTLKTLHTEVRAISHDLMPPVFKYATLPEILEDYVSQRDKPGKTEITLSIQPEEGWENIPQNTGLEIYRIIQEVTGNALKHAEASRIDISLLWNENRIEIMVADNGKGFDKERKGTGIGMNIIRERVRNLKGQLRIDTAPGKGTKIQVELSTGDL